MRVIDLARVRAALRRLDVIAISYQPNEAARGRILAAIEDPEMTQWFQRTADDGSYTLHDGMGAECPIKFWHNIDYPAAAWRMASAWLNQQNDSPPSLKASRDVSDDRELVRVAVCPECRKRPQHDPAGVVLYSVSPTGGMVTHTSPTWCAECLDLSATDEEAEDHAHRPSNRDHGRGCQQR